MSYNWKGCSFYPNNFDASALDLGRDMCVPRSGYMCTSVGIHVYLGRDTCVPRSERDDHQASLTLSLRVFKDNRDNRDNFSRRWMSERYLFGM